MNPFNQAHGLFQPLEGKTFRFTCHPEIVCFNRCCADLNLILTPYDILCLKNKLRMTSNQFLEKYAETKVEDRQPFPRVKLKMSEKEGRPCPFVSPEGCTVYEDRPGACRIYPLGRGSAPGGREIFFLVKEDHCQGFNEEREWTVETWQADQGLIKYNAINDLWMEIITSRASLGPPEHRSKKMQMFFMASYNLDRFREFIFQSRFCERFVLDSKTIEAIRTDDLALLKFGFKWLQFSLFGKQTMYIREEG
ncbi:MAG: YkgJ family cysteine cluster protein [Deltaproteobacteria bacterium]|nr:YkgJ family cysteine cluster protein [Deltaproteobacteria bacterium]